MNENYKIIKTFPLGILNVLARPRVRRGTVRDSSRQGVMSLKKRKAKGVSIFHMLVITRCYLNGRPLLP